MIRYRDIKRYFAMPYNAVMADDLSHLQRLYSGGFAGDVPLELRSAFTGYMDSPEGDAVRPFAKKCHDLLGV